MTPTVTFADGGHGVWERGSDLAEPGQAVIRLTTGKPVVVPEDALVPADGGYRLPFAVADLGERGQAGHEDDTVVIPLIAEELRVSKSAVVTGGIRLTKRISEREETVDKPLLQEKVSVERVAIGTVVSEAPQARQEGDTLIVPVLEEVLVVEKRLLLKEEVRITRTRTQVHQPQSVTLRTEEAIFEEIAPQAPLV